MELDLNLVRELAPEVRPLAWLVGQWRGRGMIAYPNVPDTTFWQEMTFDHDGGPYLRCVSTIYATPDVASFDPQEFVDVASDAPRHAVWSTESSYWRVTPGSEEKTELEILVTDPAGHLSLYLGEAGPGRVRAVSDLIARTQSAAPVTAAQRMYGLVEGDMFWAWDLAAFGQDLQSYAAGRLRRVVREDGT